MPFAKIIIRKNKKNVSPILYVAIIIRKNDNKKLRVNGTESNNVAICVYFLSSVLPSR